MTETLFVLNEYIFGHQESGKCQQFQEVSSDLPTTDLHTQLPIGAPRVVGRQDIKKKLSKIKCLKRRELCPLTEMDHWLVLCHSSLLCISAPCLTLMEFSIYCMGCLYSTTYSM